MDIINPIMFEWIYSHQVKYYAPKDILEEEYNLKTSIGRTYK